MVFAAYPLRLTRFLGPAFGLGLPLQTASPLHSLLMIHGLPDGFAMDDPRVATHLSRHALLDLVNTVAIHVLAVSSVRNTDSMPFHGTPITRRELTIRQPPALPGRAIHFSRTAFASAANGDVIPKSMNVLLPYRLYGDFVTKPTLLCTFYLKRLLQ